MPDKWIIEARHPDGTLDLTAPQPEDFFGLAAINGMTDWEMSRIIFKHDDNVVLTGDSIATWPRAIDGRFTARRKTW